MPDWLTHLCFAYILLTIAGIKEHRSLVYLGAVLPDLCKLSILFGPLVGYTNAGNFFLPLHTILGVMLTGALFSASFRGIEWAGAYKLVLIGAFSHLFLDSLLNPFGDIFFFFYPFWVGYVRFGIIWSDSYLPAVISVIIVMIVWGCMKYKHKVSFRKETFIEGKN